MTAAYGENPDLITLAETNQGVDFIIFDAKYYNTKLEPDTPSKGQPGIESISKQYLYQLAYQKFIKDHDFCQQNWLMNIIWWVEK